MCPDQMFSVKDVSILAVDDETEVRNLYDTILTEEGYRVTTASCGEEAVERIKQEKFNLLLLDLKMPGMSGTDVLKAVPDRLEGTSVIIVTAYPSLESSIEAIKSGVCDYVIKPFSPKELRNIVRMVAEKAKLIEENKKKERELAVATAAAEAQKLKARELEDANEKLRETQNMLIQAEKMRALGQLASGVAHEVRNPLAIIILGINYLEEKLPKKKGRNPINDTLKIIKDSVKRADKIIRMLYDFSRVTELDLKKEDINSVINTSLALVKNKLKLEKNIKVSKEIKIGLPKVLVDKNKIEQVFVNALLNAVQAMPNGGQIIIRSYDKLLTEPGNGAGNRKNDNFKVGETALIVEIEDTGIGISRENMSKIFDPFFTTKGPQKGIGLGLSVSKNIIDLHRGFIYAESEEGKGTKIIIKLKIAKEGGANG
ncbi:MAG: response regulator [Candidatus Omnitrophica bacterium]|nr:response regulator [Candidatus Omnitrophota bacterium]